MTKVEDIFDDGDVISFQKRFTSGPQRYSYVAIKAAGRWYLSGDSNAFRTFDALVKYMRKDNELPDNMVQLAPYAEVTIE